MRKPPSRERQAFCQRRERSVASLFPTAQKSVPDPDYFGGGAHIPMVIVAMLLSYLHSSTSRLLPGVPPPASFTIIVMVAPSGTCCLGTLHEMGLQLPIPTGRG